MATLHCSFCAAIQTKSVAQCANCLCKDKPIRVLDLDWQCTQCHSQVDMISVYGCGHWTCVNCKTKCPSCKSDRLTFLTKRNIDIPPKIMPEMARLYPNLDGDHETKLILIREYIRWLYLKADDHDFLVPPDMIPPDAIDRLWTRHIIDTVRYRVTCRLITQSDAFIDRRCNFMGSSRVGIFHCTLSKYIDKYGPMDTAAKSIWTIQDFNMNDRLAKRMYQIFIKKDHWTYTFSVGSDITCLQLKQMVQQKEGIPPEQQRLIIHGNQLQDHWTMAECGIVKESTLTLMLNLRGC